MVERSLPVGEPFIPNDICLDQQDEQIMIITGQIWQVKVLYSVKQAHCFASTNWELCTG